MQTPKTKTTPDFMDVTRLEVIDEKGRSYVNMGATALQISLQDQGKTLKIFCNGTSHAKAN